MASSFSRRDFLPAGLEAEQVELVGNTIRVHSRSARPSAGCPHCGTISRHVHSRYLRRPADLPAHGRRVELVLLVRRFRCRAMHCPAKIFAERFPPAVTRPHARRTSRLQGLVRHLGLALGGRPAQALAGRLLLPVSKDTFLRSIRDTAEAARSELRAIGIDDWAWRKVQRYGTLICDLERRRVIDLLPDREVRPGKYALIGIDRTRAKPIDPTRSIAPNLCCPRIDVSLWVRFRRSMVFAQPAKSLHFCHLNDRDFWAFERSARLLPKNLLRMPGISSMI